KIRERVQLTRHIGQGEVGRAQRRQCFPLVGAKAEVPGGGRGVACHRLVHQLSKRGQIEPFLSGLFVQKIRKVRFGQRKTKLFAATALGLHFKARGAGEVRGSHPELIGAVWSLCRIDVGSFVVIDDRGADIFGDGGQSRHHDQQKDAKQETCFHSSLRAGRNYTAIGLSPSSRSISVSS